MQIRDLDPEATEEREVCAQLLVEEFLLVLRARLPDAGTSPSPRPAFSASRVIDRGRPSQYDQRCVLGRAQQALVLSVGAELLPRHLRDEIVGSCVDDGALVGRERATARGLVLVDERRGLLARRR